MENVFDQFDSAKKSVAGGANDVVVSFAQGANGLLKALGDVYGLTTGEMDNWASRQGQENIDYLQREKTPEMVEVERRRKAAVDAETEPHKKAWAYVANTAPEWRLVLGDIAAAAPSTVASGGAGAAGRLAAGKLLGAGAQTAAKIGTGTAIAAGAGINAGDAGAQQYAEMVKTLGEMPDEEAMQIPQIEELVREKGSTIGAAKTALALSMARDTGVFSGLLSAATMMVPGSNALERTIAGGKTAKPVVGSLLRTVAKDAAGETAQELAENVGTEGIKNVVARKVEPERELTKGMGEAAGASVIPAAVMGGMGGVAQHTQSEPKKVLSQPVPEGKPLAGIPEEPPAPVATRSQLTDAPQIDLTKVENLSEDQFWAAVDARQAMQTGVELPDYQKGVLAETEMPEKTVDPELSSRITKAVETLVEEWKQENPNAADLNVSAIFDPNMLHNGYGIRGAFNQSDNSILLNAAFLQGPEVVKQVLNHEWAHQTLSTEEGQAVLREFAQRALPQGELEALSKQYQTDDLLVLVDEWIAKNQEQAPGFIARMVQQIREWLAKVGLVNLTDQEVANIMLRTLRQQSTREVAPVTEEEPGPSETREASAYSVTDDPGEQAYNTFIAERGATSDPRYSLTSLPMAGDLRNEDGSLKYTVPKKKLTVSHFSTKPDLEVIDPSFMGKGGAGQGYHRMMKGEDKSFFFVGTSKPARAENVTGGNRYTTTIDSSRIYNMDTDPLNLWSAVNPAKSEGLLKQAGYDGFYAETKDGRKFVALFYPTDVKTGEIARTEQSLPIDEMMSEGPKESAEEYLARVEAEEAKQLKRFLRRASKGKYSLTDQQLREAAESQRDVPESQMLQSVSALQKAGGPAIYGDLLEHVGDLSHRLQEPGYQGGSAESKIAKLNRLLNPPENRLGLEQEIESGLRANAEYALVQKYDLGDVTPIWKAYDQIREQHSAEIDRMVEVARKAMKEEGEKYAQAHETENKPVTYAGRLGRDAAIALGRMDFAKLREVAKELTDFYEQHAGTDRIYMEQPGTNREAAGLMASPSISDIQYDRAVRNLTSSEQARFKAEIAGYMPGAQVFDAIGDWKDGAENSVAAIYDEVKTPEELQKVAAKAGLAGFQKSILWWTTDPKGTDSIHRIIWPKTVSMAEARQAMIDVGLENRTLIQTPQGVQGFVFDGGNTEINKIEALHDHETDPSFESAPSTGAFLGARWDNSKYPRAEARGAYRRVLGSAPQAKKGTGEREREGGSRSDSEPPPDQTYGTR